MNKLFFEGQCKLGQSQASLNYAGCSLNSIFYQLIRVAIGTAECLSHTPKYKEWLQLYEMAKKQSLVGICFAGVQRLQAQKQAPNSWGDERGEMLYLQWMGMAAKIQQRNEVVNRRCAELGERLERNGYRYVILKGQGVASLYQVSGSTGSPTEGFNEFQRASSDLSKLRQSGDIDVWIDGDMKKTIKGLNEVGNKIKNVNIKHADAEFFKDTQVEVHFMPSWFYDPIVNRRWKKWCRKFEGFKEFEKVSEGFIVPSAEFNVVFLLLHMYRHLFDEGVGLRQMMDYYMVLRTVQKVLPYGQAAKPEQEVQVSSSMFQEVSEVLNDLRLLEFAAAAMWVQKEVFGLEREYMICESSEKYGRLLLEEIMRGGNFGKFDERNDFRGKGDIALGLGHFVRNLRYLRYYPSEVLWAPIWKLWHWGWRKKNGY